MREVKLSLQLFFFQYNCHFIIICEKWRVEEGLPQRCSQAGGSTTLRWALIEPADLTFVSLTLRGASAPCQNHNTISTCELLTSAAQRSRGEAGRHRRLAESLCFCCSAAALLVAKLHSKNHKSVFCSHHNGPSVCVTF